MFKSKLISLHKPIVINLFNFLFKTKTCSTPYPSPRWPTHPSISCWSTWSLLVQQYLWLGEPQQNTSPLSSLKTELLMTMTMVMVTLVVIMMTTSLISSQEMEVNFSKLVSGGLSVHFTLVYLSKGPLWVSKNTIVSLSKECLQRRCKGGTFPLEITLLFELSRTVFQIR